MSSSGVKGLAPCAFSHRFFAQKSGVAESRRLRDPAAERQRPQEADQIESRNKKLHTLLCAARAVPFSQGLTMRGSRGLPLALSWGFKGVILYGREWPLWSCRRQAANVAPLSSGKCGAAVKRQMSHRPQAADLTRSPVSGCRKPRHPSSAASGSARRRCSWP